ncbi:MAG TPA: transposase [Candidatus Angelobacter sp.]
MELAATRTIRKKGETWIVPSQAGADFYQVTITAETESCTCPDFATRKARCKHMYAAAYFAMREINSKGEETVTETLMVAETKRRTYPQDWKNYNAAQVEEQDRFQVLLHDLCKNLPTIAPKPGRPPLPLSDAVFICAFKIYSTMSQRRFMSDLRESHKRGYISRVPHFNCVSNALENPNLSTILKSLITQSSLPLKSLETSFSVDSSGFTTSRFIRWYDHKYGKPRQRHEWVKIHLMTGNSTHIVTSVEIGERYAGDSPYFVPMVKETAENFKIGQVCADSAYSSNKNAAAVYEVGGTPFIDFKANAVADSTTGSAYRQMFHFFQYQKEKFLAMYHQRSNIESVNAMIKAKFGDSLRSRTDTAMRNEALCKVLAHNIVCLIQAIHELGTQPTFWNGHAEAAN